jgi:hypothetical protein
LSSLFPSLQLPLCPSRCFFTREANCRVVDLIRLEFQNNAGTVNVNELYSRIEACFLSCSRFGGQNTQPKERRSLWWQFVPPELHDEVRELEADCRCLFEEWSRGSSSFSVSDVVTLRR